MFNTSSLQWSQIRADTGAGNYPGVNVETASAVPLPRNLHALTFDEDARCFYVFGGLTAKGSPSLSDVWKFNLTTMNWTPLTAVYSNTMGNYPASAAVDTVGAYPGSRCGSSLVLDRTGSTTYLYMYGGSGNGRGVTGRKLVST